MAAPHSFGNVKPVEEHAGIRIDQACIGSCANGRFEDIEIAAKILKGRKVKRGVRIVHSTKELTEKLGRNDLCPCGSRKRFKKCCLKNKDAP